MTYQGNPRQPRRDDREPRKDFLPKPTVSKADLETIIAGTEDNAVQKLVETAQAVGEWLKQKDFSTSQIRNIFGEVRGIEQRVSANNDAELEKGSYRELVLLKPKLAYQHARAGGEGKKSAKGAMEFLRDLLSDAIDLVGRDRARFLHFVDFFEAILAYHRSAGGK